MAAHIIGNKGRRRLIFPNFPRILSIDIRLSCSRAQGPVGGKKGVISGWTPWLGRGLVEIVSQGRSDLEQPLDGRSVKERASIEQVPGCGHLLDQGRDDRAKRRVAATPL